MCLLVCVYQFWNYCELFIIPLCCCRHCHRHRCCCCICCSAIEFLYYTINTETQNYESHYGNDTLNTMFVCECVYYIFFMTSSFLVCRSNIFILLNFQTSNCIYIMCSHKRYEMFFMLVFRLHIFILIILCVSVCLFLSFFLSI